MGMTVQEAVKSQAQMAVNGSFAAIASNFIKESLESMIVWLIVMFSVIVCDLAFGVRKRIKMNEAVRISKAVRDTMGKMVTYFSFVFMIVVIANAAGNHNISYWAILTVCAVELISIAGNYLAPMGYNIHMPSVFTALMKKILGLDKEYTTTIIQETNIEQKKEDGKNEAK